MATLTYRNPIQPDRLHLRDPFVLAHPHGFYLYASPTARPDRPDDDHFDAWFSRDLVHWAFSGQVHERPDNPTWNAGGFRGPQVFERSGRFFLFYSARSGTGRSAVGVAVSHSPLGPFLDLAGPPLTPPQADCTDGHLYTDPGGTHWLLFAERRRPAGHDRLLCRRLSGDLMRPAGEPFVLVQADQAPWTGSPGDDRPDARLLEAPVLLVRNGRFYLMASSLGRQGYCVGYFSAEKLEGPWTARGTVIRHDGGHNCVFTGPDGKRLYTAYHAPNGPPGAERLCIDEVRLLDDGSLFVDESRGQQRTIVLP